MAINLVQVRISRPALARWAGERGWVRRRGGASDFDEGRALHHLVDEVFGPGALRPFRLLVPPRCGSGSLYAYSALDAQSLTEAARFHALPDHLQVLSPDQVQTKSMPEDWRAGQKLGFDARVRPVRRLLSDLESREGLVARKGSEIDAFLVEAHRRHPAECGGMASEDRTREEVYLDWLTERLAPAAILERGASRLARFHRVRVARGKRGPEGPDATIHGTLTVAEPDSFVALLARGVGRHRAYGYGMLLLRPPNRPAPES